MYLQVREFGSEVSKDISRNIIKIQSLDSSIKHVKSCIWNQVIRSFGSSGRYLASLKNTTTFNGDATQVSFGNQEKEGAKDDDDDDFDEEIRIFFDGKELASQYSVYQYGIKFNDVLQYIYLRPSIYMDGPLSVENNSSKFNEINNSTTTVTPCGENKDQETFQNIENIFDGVATCQLCQDDDKKLCKNCSCAVCGLKENPSLTLICDECENYYHTYCVNMETIPNDDDWFCFNCKNDDLKLIKLKEDEFLKKKMDAKKLSSLSFGDAKTQSFGVHASSARDAKPKWGRGISCIGRRFQVNTSFANNNYFGPIPGIEVGTMYRFRFQLSELGLHTPLVAGVCGKESQGVVSIVFSNSYIDDIDLGNEIYFSGSGGTNSSVKTSRTGNVLIKDQVLSKSNRALAKSCYALIDEVNGSDAGNNWRLGKPIRLFRSGNSRGKVKKSIYLPKLGIRYDGLYKVVKYWREKSTSSSANNNNNSASSFFIWKFLLRRDDVTPPPWTKEGKNRIRRLKLDKIIDPMQQLSVCNEETIPEDVFSRNEKCAICLNEMTSCVTLINCNHSFDFICLKEWLISSFGADENDKKKIGDCPTCRRGIEVINYKQKIIKSINNLMRTKL